MNTAGRKVIHAVRSFFSALIDRRARREARIIAPFFDADFYLSTYPDVAASGKSPCLHYAQFGWREGRDPSPSFSTAGYLAGHPDVALAEKNPLLHFAEAAGQAEERPATEPVAGPAADDVVRLVADHVDTGFYKAKYAQFVDTGLEAAEHYCTVGWREGHDPAPDFSTNYYLSTNPDIKASGVNPYWHFLIAGRGEGRLPTHPGGWRHGVISGLKNFETLCADWKRRDAPPACLTADAIREKLSDQRENGRLMISVGHDDYRISPGGVQLCIEMEADLAASKGFDYLNLHPWQPLPKLADAASEPIMMMVLNGQTLGAANMTQIAQALVGNAGDGAELVIHHLSGHAPEEIVALAKALGLSTCHFWLHDYFTLCTSYALQRNNVASCDAPSITSNACHVCVYGKERGAQAARVSAFFGALDVHLASPSEVALSFWKSRTDLRTASVRVEPHVVLTREKTPVTDGFNPEAPIRIAFVGTPVPHKGWPVFAELQKRLSADAGFEFFFFGAETPVNSAIEHIRTHVRSADPGTVTQAIRDQNIDIVLHWASWRETFSFSAFEALAGGAFVLTNSGSGNVAAAVRKHRRGKVLDDADALFELAKNGGLADLAREARKRRGRARLIPSYSQMSFAFLEQAELAA